MYVRKWDEIIRKLPLPCWVADHLSFQSQTYIVSTNLKRILILSKWKVFSQLCSHSYETPAYGQVTVMFPNMHAVLEKIRIKCLFFLFDICLKLRSLCERMTHSCERSNRGHRNATRKVLAHYINKVHSHFDHNWWFILIHNYYIWLILSNVITRMTD